MSRRRRLTQVGRVVEPLIELQGMDTFQDVVELSVFQKLEESFVPAGNISVKHKQHRKKAPLTTATYRARSPATAAASRHPSTHDRPSATSTR